MDIESLRKEIDQVDKEILSLFAKRMKISKQIAKIKQKSGEKIISTKREADILSKLKKLSVKKGLNFTFISSVFNLILKESRDIQKKEIS